MRFFLNVALVGVGLAGIPVAFAKANDFGGPESVGSRIANDLDQEALYPQPSPLQPYFDWKKSLEDRSGFSYSLSALLLYQGADSGEDAFGGVYRFSGSWNLFGGETGNPGRLEFRVENRSNLGGSKAPGDLGGAIGAAALNPGFGYSSNFDTDLAVFNWTQHFNNKRGGFALGRLAFDAYLDPYAFQTFSRAFVNRGFVLNPTVATTGVGALGFVAKGFVTDNLWIGGQIHDANARSGEFEWDILPRIKICEKELWFGVRG